MAGTVIEEGLEVEGEISSEDELYINGSVRGKLHCSDAVSVGANGIVEAEVKSNSLTIAGQVKGDVNVTERVDLQAGGRLIGDVKTARFTIADGATFKGNVDMDV